MAVADDAQNLLDVRGCQLLTESRVTLAPHNVIEQVAAFAVLGYEQKLVALLEHFEELQDVWVVQPAQDGHLIPKVLQLLFGQPVSHDDLDCAQLTTRPLDALFDFSERARPNLTAQLVTVDEFASLVLNDEVRAAEGQRRE